MHDRKEYAKPASRRAKENETYFAFANCQFFLCVLYVHMWLFLCPLRIFTCLAVTVQQVTPIGWTFDRAAAIGKAQQAIAEQSSSVEAGKKFDYKSFEY